MHRSLLQVMDALKMEFPDNSFDLVWACESGEHMPDKKAYVDEMMRVLKPGGTLVIATWCQREETPETPFRCAAVIPPAAQGQACFAHGALWCRAKEWRASMPACLPNGCHLVVASR